MWEWNEVPKCNGMQVSQLIYDKSNDLCFESSEDSGQPFRVFRCALSRQLRTVLSFLQVDSNWADSPAEEIRCVFDDI